MTQATAVLKSQMKHLQLEASSNRNQSINQVFLYWRKKPFWNRHRRGGVQ